ncbi:MAG TPA: amidohydrolase [Steroidobacteraceae bacterium]|nr:amidohydrolase [Steroidobacteraceae bacterium]
MIGCIRTAVMALGFLSSAAFGAAAPDAGTATILYDAQVFTAEPLHPYANAVAIRGDRIIAVGDLAAVEKAAGPGARKVDLKGKFLMPGMIDGHAHPIAGGVTLIQANYPDTRDSIPDLKRFVAEHLQKKDSRLGDTLVVNAVDIGYWAHAAEIDAALSSGAFADQPVVLYGSDGHTAWANKAARGHAGITAQYIRGLPASLQHCYGFDPASFEPNGFMVDACKIKLDSSLPAPSAETMLKAGEAAMHYMNGLGITGWLDAAVAGVVGGAIPVSVDNPGYLPVYKALAEHGELTAHVAAYPVVKPDDGSQQIDVVEALRAKYQGIPNLTIPGLKVFADGVVEIPSQTAALTKPYRNTGRSGRLLFTPAKMDALVTEAARRGLNVHVHAIGDLAVKAALDAFEAARKAVPQARVPFSLTHAQFVDPEDIPRFAELHVLASLQLLWAVADPSTNEQVKPYIDPSIYRWMYPARSMLDSGAVIAGASDWPVSSANPFEAIYQAETRSGPQGVLDAAERMPREAMLYAYTRNSALVLDQLKEIGSIAPGKRADLALIDRDVLTVPAEEMKDARVLFTMWGGKIIYGHEP